MIILMSILFYDWFRVSRGRSFRPYVGGIGRADAVVSVLKRGTVGRAEAVVSVLTRRTVGHAEAIVSVPTRGTVGRAKAVV